MSMLTLCVQMFPEQASVVINSNKSGDGYFLDACLVSYQAMVDVPYTQFSVDDHCVRDCIPVVLQLFLSEGS